MDASVAVKWFVVEEDADRAINLLQSGQPLLAPRWIMTELANILWKKTRQKLLTPQLASERLGFASHYFAQLLDVRDMAAILDLAIELDHPVYDCIYIQTALEVRMPLITADLALLRKARAIPDLEILGLSEWKP